MATISEADDLRIILSDQRGELMAAETLDSDLDLAFQIQMQEAIAASLALRRPSSPPSDVRNDIVPSSSNVQRDMGDDMHRDEDRDRKHSEAETSKAREDYWSKYKKPYDSSGASSSSSSKCSRLYFKGLVVGERVRDTDMVVAAAGIAICDPEDNLVFQSRKNLEAFDGGEVMTSEAAELEALVEGLNRALSYGFKKIVFFCDDNKIFNYVTNGLPPRNSKVAALVDQVDLLQSKFTYCSPSLVARDNIKFAFKCAREAIVSQITWSEKAGKGKSFKETCLICFEDIDVAQMFSVDGCLHRYCFSCMKQHVEAKLHNGQIARCPHDGCNSELAADSCAKVLPPTLMDVMDQRIKEFSIPDAQKIYCPNPKCSALMSKDEVLEYTKVSIIDAEQTGVRKCMKCRKSFCINCKVPWHFDKTCDDYRIENPPIHDDEQMLKSLATEKLWRQCARCNHMIELLEGCSHITCRCKYEFCYTCGAEWKNKRPTCFCPLINHRQQREPLPQPQPQLQQQQLGPGLQQLHQQIQQVQLQLRLGLQRQHQLQQQSQLQPHVGLQQRRQQPLHQQRRQQQLLQSQQQQQQQQLHQQQRQQLQHQLQLLQQQQQQRRQQQWQQQQQQRQQQLQQRRQQLQ